MCNLGFPWVKDFFSGLPQPQTHPWSHCLLEASIYQDIQGLHVQFYQRTCVGMPKARLIGFTAVHHCGLTQWTNCIYIIIKPSSGEQDFFLWMALPDFFGWKKFWLQFCNFLLLLSRVCSSIIIHLPASFLCCSWIDSAETVPYFGASTDAKTANIQIDQINFLGLVKGAGQNG